MISKIIKQDLKAVTQSKVPWKSLAGKSILITGANGSIASYMIETLLYLNDHILKKPAQIYGLVRNPAKAKKRFAAYKGNPNLKLIKGDLSKPINIKEKLHFIIHAASQTSPELYHTDPVGTMNPNIIGTHHLLNLALKNPIESFLFFSSCLVYGSLNGNRIKEKSVYPLDFGNVGNCYAQSKLMGEAMCLAWQKQYKVPAKIVRPFNTYGPGMALGDGKVFTDFVSNIVNEENIVIKGDGKPVRSYCYLADAIVGLFLILLKGAPASIYNLGNPDSSASTLNLAKRLTQLVHNKKLKVIRQNNFTPKHQSPECANIRNPDISKLKALGWNPVFSIETGFLRTMKSYRKDKAG